MIALAKLDKKIDAFISKKSKVKLPPKMMVAGFTPPSMSWTKASPETTAAIPKENAPLPPAETSASLKPVAPQWPAAEPAPAQVPAAGPPQIALTSLDEVEHPEELIFEFTPVLPLMGDKPVSADRHLAQLTAPALVDENGYLLRDADEGYSKSLAKALGYTQQAYEAAYVTEEPIRQSALANERNLVRTASR